ncbi:GDSL esterase lipase 7-like [Olea europaea subsp. europaea]|uniref:GDSL esterase lipase 7-like n=2 Tax=Olea europaea subsp. europaea TaxID=158383 RepID=A0A8S0UZ91_OLEEU|nr:GDSL esterase lipase 7-like [Olea europaea subsp. europaea]
MANRGLVHALCFVIFFVISGKHDALELRFSNQSSVKAMYILGDSSVDCGGNTPFYNLIHHSLSLYPCNGSDSSLVPHLLAKKMNLSYAIPFYSQNGTIHDLLTGVNFGAAHATILYVGSRGYQSLNQQLRQTFETIQLLQLWLGQEFATEFIESSLFYLSLGKDDFIDYFHSNSSRISPRFSGQNFTHILVNQMTNAIRNLYANDARKIVCAGILPLGCAPRMLSMNVDRRGCASEVNMLVSEYNTRLEEKIVALNAELSGAHIIFCDVYRAIMEFVNNPQNYGVKDVHNACCGLGRHHGMTGCLSTDMACNQSSSYVWWDLYNPTPAVNSLLANSAWSGDPLAAICRPITVQELVSSSV